MGKATNIQTDDEIQIDETKVHSLADLLLQSDLLAGMARADGKVLGIENMVAETYFEQQDNQQSTLVKQHYDYIVQDEDTDARLSTVMGFMKKLSTEDKYKLLRCLSAVAVCDGDLDPRELAIIQQFAKVMEIDPGKI
jgi:uncharacterized tellurite resistance protein B-like protein